MSSRKTADSEWLFPSSRTEGGIGEFGKNLSKVARKLQLDDVTSH